MKRIAPTLAVCLFAASIAAQNAPPPPEPYPSPITGYAGRYLDSSSTAQIQFVPPNPRTLRATKVKVAADRNMLYMIVGSTFVGQTLSTFADRVTAGPLAQVPRPGFFGPGEKYLPFEKWVDAERTPGWQTVFQDGQDRLMDFDFDDRGYIYLAYSVFGFGIIDANFQKVAQLIAAEPGAERVVVFRNGTSCYALLSNSTTSSRIYDVTTPSAPVLLPPPVRPAFVDAARSSDGRIALVPPNGLLQIHTPATLLANAAPIFTSAGIAPFREVATDGTNFYALGNGGRTIHILQPSGGSYTETTIPSFSNLPYRQIEYGAGYLSLAAADGGFNPIRATIYRVDGTSLTLLHDGQYFIDWLFNLGSEHPYRIIRQLLPVHDGEQTLLITAFFGLGDVFPMSPQAPLTVNAQFSPSPIPAGGTSTLTITITNPNPVPVTFGLTDTYPTNVFNTGSGAQTTCGGGIVTAAALSGTFSLTNATVAAASSCTVTLPVTATLPGTYNAIIEEGAIASSDNSNAAPATAALIVEPLDAPGVQKSFAPSSAQPGTPVRMTITLTNPNASAITGVAFTDNYPAILVNATPVNASNTCGGVLVAANGGNSLALTGGTIPASGGCSVAVDVFLTQQGVATNTIPAGGVTSANADPSAAAATATLASAPFEAIPTLSEWAILALMAMLGVAALLRIRM